MTPNQASDERSSDLDIPHHLFVTGSYLLGDVWKFEGRLDLKSGLPVADIDGSIFSGNEGYYTPVVDEVNGKRLPFRHSLAVKVSRKIDISKMPLWVYADITGLWGLAGGSVVDRAYTVDYSDSTDISAFPMRAVVGAKGDF